MNILVVVDMQNDFIDGSLGTEEAQRIVPEVVKKIQTFDGTDKVTFGSRELVKKLEQIQEETSIESITLIGLCTDICVISNAMLCKAFLPEVPVQVDASCCAGVTVESHMQALEAMKMCQIDIL